jgi:hypothetical protein
VEPSIEIALGIEAPLNRPEAMNVAHVLGKIVSQGCNLGVETSGQRMQIGTALIEGTEVDETIGAL